MFTCASIKQAVWFTLSFSGVPASTQLVCNLCNAGLEPREAYQIGLPAIGITAVLVANVTFLGWATPPGGSTPYWQSCNYPIFTAFLILNSVAFMLALAAVVVVTAFPLFLSKKPQHAVALGGILLCWCLVAFIVAFILGGFVTVGYRAPTPDCATIRCSDGGVPCFNTVGHTKYGNIEVTESGLPESNAYYILDDRTGTLNKDQFLQSVNSSGYDPLVCLPYLQSTYDGNVSSIKYGLTLHPEFPSKLPNLRPATDRLLYDAYYQRSCLCGRLQSFGYIYGYNARPGWSIAPIPTLTGQLSDYVNSSSNTTVADLIAERNLGLVAYTSLKYKCFGTRNPPGSFLCDTAQSDLENVAVSATGAYMTLATVSSFGGKVTTASGTSDQIAVALWVVITFFVLVFMSLALYVWRHK